MYISNVNSSSIKILSLENLTNKAHDTIQLSTNLDVMIIFITKGSAQFSIYGKQHQLKANELLMINPQQEVTLQVVKDLHYSIIHLSGFVFTSSQTLNSTDTIFHLENTSKNLHYYFDLAKLENQERMRGTDLILKRLVECIMIYILRNSDLSIRNWEKPNKTDEIDTIKHYIREHYSEKITLDELAKVLKINKFYLIRIFKQNTGLSPIDYLIHVRIEEAENLLLNTDIPIVTISQNVGFHSPSHFSKAFRIKNHVTPSEYRKLHQNTTRATVH